MSWSLTTLLTVWSSPGDFVTTAALLLAALAALAVVLAARLRTAPRVSIHAVAMPARARAGLSRPPRATDPDAPGRPRPRAPGRR